jgi:hypothetical protein
VKQGKITKQLGLFYRYLRIACKAEVWPSLTWLAVGAQPDCVFIDVLHLLAGFTDTNYLGGLLYSSNNKISTVNYKFTVSRLVTMIFQDA